LARSLAAVALAGLLASCGGGSTPTTPSATPTTVTDVFSGTLAAGGSTFFPFTVTTQGTITATLTTLSPQTSITMGFGIGQPSSGSCALISGAYTESEKVAQALSGTIAAGSYCVVLYDIGNIQGSDDFVITVVHS
jgi:hypothetical protein